MDWFPRIEVSNKLPYVLAGFMVVVQLTALVFQIYFYYASKEEEIMWTIKTDKENCNCINANQLGLIIKYLSELITIFNKFIIS